MKSIMMSLTAMRLSLAQAGFLLAMVLLASPVRSTDLVLETVWDSLRPIEEYRHEVGSSEPPRLIARRTYGLGLDEVVKLELDVDGDGTLTEYLPFYDSTGNLALITDVTGKPIERYSYSPHGERTIRVHSTPPTVEQVRVEAGQLVIELSEETSGEALVAAVTAGTLRLLNVTTGQTIAIAIDRPVLTGRAARRRLVITGTDPPETTAWPQPGESVELVVGTAALVDLFANQAVAEYRQTCSWPVGELLVDDATAPRLEQVCVLSGRILELTFSEKVDAALAAGEILLNGAAVAWQQEGADGYTLRTAAPLAAGSYTLSLGTGPLDLAGLGLSAAVSESFAVVETSPERLIFSTPLPGQVASSTIGNVLGFHGLPQDPETGLIYVRRRYYDPELGRWLTADPLGYVDGPNLYQFALNNPVNYSDPTGEVVIPCAIAGGVSALAGWGINAAFGLEYSWSDAALDFSLGAVTCGAGSAIQGLTKVGTVGKVALTAGADVGLTFGTEKTRAFLHGEGVSSAQLLRGAVLGAGIGHAVQFGGGRLFGGLRARFSGESAVEDMGWSVLEVTKRALPSPGQTAKGLRNPVLVDTNLLINAAERGSQEALTAIRNSRVQATARVLDEFVGNVSTHEQRMRRLGFLRSERIHILSRAEAGLLRGTVEFEEVFAAARRAGHSITDAELAAFARASGREVFTAERRLVNFFSLSQPQHGVRIRRIN